jgi:glutamate racemase
MTNIGVFDSGVGGLWILKHLRAKLPGYNYIFFGDQGHVPYGDKSKDEIRDFSENITKFLIGKGCRVIVIACNTASAASLKYLRGKFPEIIFVGMEPAVKPASEITHTNKIGILATPMTFQGELFNSAVDKYANGIEIFKNTCDGLVLEIEKGDFDGQKTKEILENALYPMLEENVDTVVLGCTHYPLVMEEIKKIVGDKMKIVDSTPSIIKQVEKVLEVNNLKKDIDQDEGKMEIFTSRELRGMENILDKLFGEKMKVEKIDLKNGNELNMIE